MLLIGRRLGLLNLVIPRVSWLARSKVGLNATSALKPMIFPRCSPSLAGSRNIFPPVQLPHSFIMILSLTTCCLKKIFPASPAPTLIHNDFKLNNMLLNAHDLAQPVAVLDWEMATIGDPLFDLAVSLGYWVNAEDPVELQTVLPTVTTVPGF